MSQHSLSTLLSRWERAYDQGRDLPASELCPDRPELASELDHILERLRQMRRLVDGASSWKETPFAAGVPPPPATWPDHPGADPVATRRTATEAPSPPLPDKVLWPAIPGYQILGELGRGGMGVVFKARQVELNRIVALKMILAGEHAGATERGRFRTETEAIARLQHPNVVQVYEVGEHQGRPFFSMEYCPGGGLDQKLNRTPLPPLEATRLVE